MVRDIFIQLMMIVVMGCNRLAYVKRRKQCEHISLNTCNQYLDQTNKQYHDGRSHADQITVKNEHKTN